MRPSLKKEKNTRTMAGLISTYTEAVYAAGQYRDRDDADIVAAYNAAASDAHRAAYQLSQLARIGSLARNAWDHEVAIWEMRLDGGL